MSMKTYTVLYAEDVPHYAAGEVEARNPQAAIRKARRMDTDSFCAYDADWSQSYNRRIVEIEGPDGELIAEDIRLDRHKPREQVIIRIAREVLRLETLHARKSDRLDLHERVVWEFRDALEAAYDAGVRARVA